MIYLDNSATTFPKPNIVKKEVCNSMDKYGGNPGRGGHKYAMNVAEKIYSTRIQLANFFGAEVGNVMFTHNCTMALNMAIKGSVKKGDHIITSCLEHNSVIRPINATGNEYTIIKEPTLVQFEKNIKPNTKLIICTYSSNLSGFIMPIKDLGQLCRKHNITFVVDVAQATGLIPINIKNMNADFICVAGHKGLYAPTGVGALISSGRVKLSPFVYGGSGTDSASLDMPLDLPDRFEAGTPNTVGIVGLSAGIKFVEDVGIQAIYEHEYELCSYMYESLANMCKVELYVSDYDKYKYTPVVCFNLKGMNSEKVADMLDQNGFAVRGGLHCAPIAHKYYNTIDRGMVRVSPSIFTKKQSVEQFIDYISKV